MEIARQRAAIAWVVQHRREGPEMRFEPGAHLQGRGVDLKVSGPGEKIAHRAEHASPYREVGATLRQAIGSPP